MRARRVYRILFHAWVAVYVAIPYHTIVWSNALCLPLASPAANRVTLRGLVATCMMTDVHLPVL